LTHVTRAADQPMRILIAHSFYRIPGGEDRYVREQVALLSPFHDVHLEARDNAMLPEGLGTAVRMVSAPPERRAIRQVIRAFQPDVIHLHNPYPSFGPEVHLAAAEAGVPLVQTAHNARLRCPNGLLFTEGSSCTRCVSGRYDQALRHHCFPTRSQAAAYAQGLWFNRFVRKLDDKVALYVAPSHFVRRRLIEWGIPPVRATVVRNFTTVPDVAPPVGERGMYLGRLSAEKGVDTLLEALRLAGDPPFDVVGGGPAAEQLHAMAASFRLLNTRFLGQLPFGEVSRAIANARYAVAPSIVEEAFGLAVVEAMAAGRPVVASDAGGLPELVEAGRGALVPPGDARALATAIGHYVECPIEAIGDGESARAFVLAECSPEAHRVALEEAYAEAINRN